MPFVGIFHPDGILFCDVHSENKKKDLVDKYLSGNNYLSINKLFLYSVSKLKFKNVLIFQVKMYCFEIQLFFPTNIVQILPTYKRFEQVSD